jgi:ubiquinone/menaquinone biosynthesis C-methylase UbiE
MIDQKISDVQSSYDRVADEYVRCIYDELGHKPLDRQLLNRFADRVKGAGLACDLGCGPGQVARYLREQGVAVCGVDLSPGMIERASQLNPGVEFRQGDMTALDVPDETWAGITAFYAIVNLPPADVEQALCEMWRVLRPGGLLLLSSTSERRFRTWRICGAARFAWISIFSVLRMWRAIFGRQASRWKKLSSGNRTLPKLNTRAGELTFLPKSHP